MNNISVRSYILGFKFGVPWKWVKKHFFLLNSHFSIFHTETVGISIAWHIVCDSGVETAKVREVGSEVPMLHSVPL